VKLIQPKRLRQGDFLADIKGWRQATPGNMAKAFVINAVTDQITVTPLLDGLLVNDVVGLASVGPPIFTLRLEKEYDLLPGDEVLLVSLDRLQGETRSMFVRVAQVVKPANIALFFVQDSPGDFAFRPGDVSASVLFVRGSALALIQKHDLFVSWLAVGESDQMPRPCDGADLVDDPCSQLKE
jgi:hypothetical protein